MAGGYDAPSYFFHVYHGGVLDEMQNQAASCLRSDGRGCDSPSPVEWSVGALCRRWPRTRRMGEDGRVEMWRGGCRPNISVAAPFVWRCLTGSTVAPFPHSPHPTGHSDFPPPASRQDVTPSPTARCTHARS